MEMLIADPAAGGWMVRKALLHATRGDPESCCVRALSKKTPTET
jgi:hypothetical protein